MSIGADARVAGFVCDGTTIGDRSTVMGDLVHEYSRPHMGWWDTDEDPPVIEDDTVVGYGARVVGGVRVGPVQLRGCRCGRDPGCAARACGHRCERLYPGVAVAGSAVA